jgi:hypothetical protein
MNMQAFFDAAAANTNRHGDTDIFPYPIENHILKDKQSELVALLIEATKNFEQWLVQYPPAHINTLVPVGLNGFRQATQQDPFWNTYLLGTTLSIATKIEKARIPIDKKSVYSYRLADSYAAGDIFRDDLSWRDFVLHSIEVAKEYKYVVVCDIADCYQRIYHHRLENALKQLNIDPAPAQHIMKILSNFTNAKSYGLPVGGPGARILVELVLDLTDRLLKTSKIRFCRYADDYHLFVDDHNDAFDKLLFLSEKLLRNDGLSIQKSKTRIMSSAEFIASQAILVQRDEEEGSDVSRLFSLKLRFDPYSARAEEDYAALKRELAQIDILGMLNKELAKTRIHGALTKRLVAAIRHLAPEYLESALLTLMENLDSLYPIFPVVAITLKSCFGDLSSEIREKVCAELREKMISQSYLLRTELHAAYAIRVLAEQKSSDNEDAVVSLHSRFTGPLVRRDVILAMAKWGGFSWLSDQISEYLAVSPWERRAFIIASYTMGDAGKHWRSHMKEKFTPFETLVRDWAAERFQQSRWEIPL